MGREVHVAIEVRCTPQPTSDSCLLVGYTDEYCPCRVERKWCLVTTADERRYPQAIAALLSAPTIADAARAAGVSEPTLWGWMQEPDFRREYQAAQQQALAARAAANLQMTVGQAAADANCADRDACDECGLCGGRDTIDETTRDAS
jgi:hypothetical protein